MKRPNRSEYLIFGAPAFGPEVIDEVVETIKSGWWGTGPRVARFQEMFRQYTGAKYALATNSGTAALHLALQASGIGPGDEVITTTLTFCATVNAIIHTGAKPVLVDVNRETQNIDPVKIRQAVTPKTKAIVPVHLGGRPCDMDAIQQIADECELLIIEDAAHAVEAVYKGRKIGSIGHLTVFSFYVTKNLAMGEGGMVTTDSEQWADSMKVNSLHGLSKDAWKRYSDDGFKHYYVTSAGFKYNMMDIQAAIGIQQFNKLEKYAERRREIWEIYRRAFADLPVICPAEPEPDTVHARHLFTLLIDKDKCGLDRDTFQNELHEMNIGSGIHFIAVHLHPYYRETYGYRRGDFPQAEYISDRTISLPFSPKLTDGDVEDVIDAVKYLVNDKVRN